LPIQTESGTMEPVRDRLARMRAAEARTRRLEGEEETYVNPR
jgi:hypothetical protein